MFSSSSALVVTSFCTFRTLGLGPGPVWPDLQAGPADPRTPYLLYLTGCSGCPGQVARIRRAGAALLLAPLAVLEGVEPGPDLVGERVREPVEYDDALAPRRLRGREGPLAQHSIA